MAPQLLPKIATACLELYNDFNTPDSFSVSQTEVKWVIMIVNARELSRTYQRGQERIAALQSINLEIETGEFVFIVGPSGGGKSTLLHLLGGMDRPSSGHLSVNGIDLAAASETQLNRFRREQVGFVFQFYNLLGTLSALDNVCLPLLAQGKSAKTARAQALEMLSLVGLEQRQKHLPAELSGGEQQRVAIARAIIAQPALILADEPTGDLDSANAEAIMHLMRALNRQIGSTFIIATHNEKITGLGERTFELVNGKIEER